MKPNELQQQCIDSIEGKYLVLAGPGTGKTFTIIQRIKAMIERGINPEKILCLTFTDAAATEMKSRLEQDLNKINTGVNIYTYHGFCYDIIENNSDDFDLPSNFKIITEAVSRAFIKECIEELNPKAFRNANNDPYTFIDKIFN
ncbi:MAG: UvrD-helicase domain-containing protein, partial [Muribaculaceae bacterium]|nr:UvrD-helicase domain-containing protein [Muribaculaceae bacterium]